MRRTHAGRYASYRCTTTKVSGWPPFRVRVRARVGVGVRVGVRVRVRARARLRWLRLEV